jgi:hypothetical protein
MKRLLILIISFAPMCLFGQTKNNTHIDQANTVNIYNGTVSIGQIIITQEPGYKVFLTSYTQSIDTTKNHKGQLKTVFNLVTENGVLFNKVITLLFDKPVISCELTMPKGGAGQTEEGSNNEKTGYRFVIGQLTAPELAIVIYSNEKIFTRIDGLSGKIGQ